MCAAYVPSITRCALAQYVRIREQSALDVAGAATFHHAIDQLTEQVPQAVFLALYGGGGGGPGNARSRRRRLTVEKATRT